MAYQKAYNLHVVVWLLALPKSLQPSCGCLVVWLINKPTTFMWLLALSKSLQPSRGCSVGRAYQ